MRNLWIQINAFIKGVIYFLKPHIFLGWMKTPLLMISNTLSLSGWISKQPKTIILNDFYTLKRNYSKRFDLYKYLADSYELRDARFDYLELGVCGGQSFEWWVSNCRNPESRFYGFDTFEGLPEDWGSFKKGDMSTGIPAIDDPRVEFFKGLFQDTLPVFLTNRKLRPDALKIVHMDADLFSSTLFSLTSLAPNLKKGDILLFDEFNVPNHEFSAFKIFCDSYYIKTRLLGAVNNYLQVAMIIE
jgi:hypothetical protein